LVIGLALQGSLGNIFSGISLLFEQPFALGEWIDVEGKEGKVVEINWRAVHLETSAGNLVIVPNSTIAQGSFTNLSRPHSRYHKEIDVAFSYDDPPRKVFKLLKQMALKCPGVIPESVQVKLISYGDFSITYRTEFAAPTMPLSDQMRDEFLLRLWYMAKRHNLTMPYPMQMEVPYRSSQALPEEQQVINLQALRGLSGLASLPVPVLDNILQHSQLRDYAEQEVVLEMDAPLEGLYLILEGKAQLLAPDIRGTLQTIGILSAREFFGENASLLSDQTSDMMVIASEDLRLLVIPADVLHRTLEQSPRLAHDLGEVMELRRRTIQSVQDAG
jgi:hypothetical protein